MDETNGGGDVPGATVGVEGWLRDSLGLMLRLGRRGREGTLGLSRNNLVHRACTALHLRVASYFF